MHKMWYDTETGGLDKIKHPILTMYFAFCDENLNQFDELSLKVKPVDMSKYEVTQEALNVNKIDLEKHLSDPETITYPEAKKLILAKFEQHKIANKRTQSLQPCGHNIPFDEGMITTQIMTEEEWRKFVHYRVLDTSNITSFLKDVNIFPAQLGNLESIAKHLGIPFNNAHNAKNDVLVNIEVYRKIKEMMGDKKQGLVGIDKNLLSIVEM